MNKEISKYLTEVMGECWHTFKCIDFEYECQCGLTASSPNSPNSPLVQNSDFSTWEGFGKLWGWSIQQSWWPDFSRCLDTPTVECNDVTHIDFRVINPETFTSSIYDFLNK